MAEDNIGLDDPDLRRSLEDYVPTPLGEIRERRDRFLSTDEVLTLQKHLIKKIGGKAGIRDLNLIESAVAAPRAGFGGEYFYVTPEDQSAVLLKHLALNHGFVDANKRTAFHSAAWHLYKNYAIDLKFTADEGVDLVMGVVAKKYDTDYISKWFSSHGTPVTD